MITNRFFAKNEKTHGVRNHAISLCLTRFFGEPATRYKRYAKLAFEADLEKRTTRGTDVDFEPRNKRDMSRVRRARAQLSRQL